MRTWLYVPAHRSRRVAGALRSVADVVVLDLEDAVALPDKDIARRRALDAVARHSERTVLVRINQPGSAIGERDIDELADATPAGLAGVRIPKCERPEDVRRIAERLRVPVFPIIETALGVERAFDLAAAHELVHGLCLGEADLTADLRCGPDGLSWPRSRIVVAARAAGLPSPPQSVWMDLRDTAGLRRSTEEGRLLGFFGRSVIHPDQIDVVHGSCVPSDGEVRAARDLVSMVDVRTEGAWVDRHGRFVDRAVVEQARQVLDLVPDAADN